MTQNKKSYVIGICGGSGSGKTTFLNALASALPKGSISIISQDNYYRPRELQHIDENGIQNFDLPEAIDSATFKKDIESLINGVSISKEEYTFNNSLVTAKTIDIDPAPILIVEGIFLFHYANIVDLLNLKIFIEAKANIKLIRRIRRDKEERNYPLDDVLYRYEHHVIPAFEKYIKPYTQNVDLTVNANRPYKESLHVMTGFLKSLVNEG